MKKWKVFLSAAAAVSMALAGCADSGRKDENHGSVYYLNFKPEQNDAWQKLASEYTSKTGVPVRVETAASGQYEAVLTQEMDSDQAPTLFQVNGPVGMENWKSYAYNLYGTPVFDQLTSDQYALFTSEDDVAAIAFCIESYGIIVNTALLAKAGYTTDDIRSFEDLKQVAQSITAREKELGFAAFTSAGLEDSSKWRFTTHLANMPIYFEYQEDQELNTGDLKGTYLDQFRNIFDLYIQNSATPGQDLADKTAQDALQEFIQGQAVFFQNGSWEYGHLMEGGIKAENLAMIPLYIGAGNESVQGLTTGTENYWMVNQKGSDEDIQATLDFMYWCVTSDEGTTALADMGLVIPFKDARPSDNVFVEEDLLLTAKGKVPVAWVFTTMPGLEWKNALGDALIAYAADPSDENWEAVRHVFVEEWKQDKEQEEKN